jgi:methyltransferase family protein
MDAHMLGFEAVADGDLMICQRAGCAYQADMSVSVPYDDAYFDKLAGYEGSEIAVKLNSGRVAFVNSFAGAETYVLDIGIGCGEFIKSRPKTFGTDVNEKAIAWLKAEGKWAESLWAFQAFTLWDVLEHVRRPNDYFKQMTIGAHVFVSMPIFSDLTRIRESKHYRPNEHYFYFTEGGFTDWMAMYGFRLLRTSDFESVAGRENILSFAFQRMAK